MTRCLLGGAVAALGVVLTMGAAPAAYVPMPLGLDRYRPIPASNPLTPEKVALGRRLFFDRRLSSSGSRSCATCHDPAHAFASAGSIATTASGIRRNVPAIVNRAWGLSFFWDGRASTLEEQVLQPVFNPGELGSSQAHVLNLMRSREYRQSRGSTEHEATLDDVARALASYVRTILAGDSAYDRFAAGSARALNPSAARGFQLFVGRAGCVNCHAGPTFTDEQFHNTGVAWQSDRLTDEGRAVVTGAPKDRGAFKTPTLRETVRTAPYMHDGSLASLDEVVAYYNRGGRPNPGLDSRIRPLTLSWSEQRDLVAFLRALTGSVREGW